MIWESKTQSAFDLIHNVTSLVITVYHRGLSGRGDPVPPAKRRVIGPIERALRKDLRSFPPEVGKGGIAEGMITLAYNADAGGLEARDLAQLLRELRLSMAQLRDMAPPGIGDDELDKQRKKRNDRMKREGRVADE